MERIRNKAAAILFFLFLGVFAVILRADKGISRMLDPFLPNQKEAIEVMEGMEEAGEQPLEERVTAGMASMNEELLEQLPVKNSLIELSGLVMKGCGVQSYYDRTYGMNITSNGYNVGSYAKTSTDFEVEQMIGFQQYLDSLGIHLLYVNEPAKYIDDSFYQEEFGGASYLNRNADLFLSRIGEAGIDTIDLRKNIQEEGLDPLSLFYRTDHHWTVPASKWAAEKIAERLNEAYGYHIDMSLYADENFHVSEYKNAWLGEQGKKVAKSYIGLDDYCMMEPKYETSYTIARPEGDLTGDFGLFINKGIYSVQMDPYLASSWHYSYYAYNMEMIHNEQADYGKVLVLGDSFETSMLPFLTLGIRDVRLVVPRDLGEMSVRELVAAEEYDTVIIAYVQSVIGAHDEEGNADYRMFWLE